MGDFLAEKCNSFRLWGCVVQEAVCGALNLEWGKRRILTMTDLGI